MKISALFPVLLFMILLSCEKTINDDDLHKNLFQVSSIKHSLPNGPSLTFEYYQDGKLKKYNSSFEYGEYEYHIDSIVFRCFESNGSQKFTKTYKIENKVTVSSITKYPNKSISKENYEYNSTGYLIRTVGDNWYEENTYTNDKLTFNALYINGILSISENFEYYIDKENNTNSELFSSFNYLKTGIDFFGKRSSGLIKKSTYKNAGNAFTYEYYYTYDKSGRILKMDISTGNYFSIQYID